MMVRVALSTFFAVALGGLTGCATPIFNPATNQPLSAATPPDMGSPTDFMQENSIVLSFSGGGLRAAAFTHGVLTALESVKTADGDLLDDVALISSVSGSSITAAHYGLYGREGLARFRDEVLLPGFESGMRLSLLRPANLMRMLGGGLNARENLGEALDQKVFRGATFADIYRRQRPGIRIHATDLYHRVPFPFLPPLFQILCSDLSRYSVADAVAASMAVPVIFAPVVVRTYPDSCQSLPPEVDSIRAMSGASRVLNAIAKAVAAYRDPARVRFIKLGDGGLTDNFAVSTLTVSRVVYGTPYAPMTERDAVKIRRLLLIVVDASQGPTGDWILQEAGPSGLDLALSATDAAVDAAARLAADAFGRMIQEWQDSVVAFRCGLNPADVIRLGGPADWRCADVRFSLAYLSVEELESPARERIERVPTRLTLEPEQVDATIQGAREGTLALPRLRTYARERIASSPQRVLPPGPAAFPAADRTWITDVTIVSPEKLDRIEQGSVLIENGRIVSVERSKGAKPPSGATVVSGTGQFLIPGLIDSHVHLVSLPGMMPGQAESKPEMVKEYFEQLPRSYLYYGYTTLVDLAVMDHKVLSDFRRAPLHPDVYDCGEPLVFANGYPMSFAPPEIRFKRFPNFIYDARQASRIPPEYKPEDHTPAAGVARVKNSGGICVKTFFEHGFARDKNLPVMGPEVFADIRKAAVRSGLVFVVHANAFAAQKFAVEGDADVLAHGMWHWGDLDKQAELPAEIRKLLDQIVERKIGYQPTIQVLQGERAYFDSEYLKSEAIAKVIPRSMREWINSREGKWFKKELGGDETPDATMLAVYDQGPLRRERQVVSYLAGKDANFLFGSDTPSGPTYGNLPGLNGYLEMQQLQKAGLSLEQIFKAATISNARKFKIDSQVGTIEPGKVANLVLLKKSPLKSLDAYDSITTVWIHGKAVARDSLAAK